ncbi:MAG: response regulator transcription factor [Desulfitobacterium hafniense]|nr:response regulator transcription factor [Desulfitobacterium hafniense]
MTIKIIIVDDHEVVRLGLRMIINRNEKYQVIGEAKDAFECFELLKVKLPDIIIMDIRLPSLSGIEACREIRKDHPHIKVLMLTSYSDDEAAVASILAGAKGFVLKQVGSTNLLEAIDTVYTGKSLIDNSLKNRVMEKLQAALGSPDEQLSEREFEVLREIAKGRTNREIAEALYLSEKTVRNYVSQILAKLNLSHRTQAAIYAVKHGFYESE